MVFRIDPAVFPYFPGMRIVCVAARGIDKDYNPGAVEEILENGWKIAGEAASAYGNPQSHPNIAPWAARMKAAGAPRKKFPSSIEAMVRRAGKGGEPFHISPAVDFYNGVSLANIVPVGGFDIGQMQEGLTLRLSEEGDTFTALDADEPEAIPAGEISYADGKQIVTRHFVWKQSKHLLLREDTRDIFFVSEILGELPEDTAASVADALTEGLRRCFGVDAEARIADEAHPEVPID